ncbi:MAG TPA: hypothetical protein VH142_07165 [Polyangiaceae bacterium]|nr:hypothetical protein [Polyangiaceae bacterium]
MNQRDAGGTERVARAASATEHELQWVFAAAFMVVPNPHTKTGHE